MKLNKRKFVAKFNLLSSIFLCIFTFLICYSFHLQFNNFQYYRNEVNYNAIKSHKIPAPRGNILDRNNIVLATTQYQNDLYIIPYYFNNDLKDLCDQLQINYDELLRKINQHKLNKLIIAKNISNELADNYLHIRGLFVYRYAKRFYNNNATTHIVGYVGKISKDVLETDNENTIYANNDYVGKSGLEYIYDKKLHGVNGAEQYVIMANGLELLYPNRFLTKNIIPPTNGMNIKTFIDDRIQLLFMNELKDQRGAAVMLDVNTGEVIAMYSSPVFDPKNIGLSFSDKNYPLINRALVGYAPGSTFKLVTALAALELGIIKPEDTFNCPGYFVFGNRVFHCWKHGKSGNGHGKVNLRDAIKHSCDVYFYNLSLKVGIKNIEKYAHLLGFGEYTGIDLDNDQKGSIVGKIIYKGSTLNTAIGQGEVLVSPLQLANAYATIINGGELHSPRIAIDNMPVILKNNTFKKDNVDFLLNALHSVVAEEGGTAYYSRIKDFDNVGCKTGTAQTASLDKKTKDNAIVVCFFPSEQPKIVVSVYVQEGQHGSSIAPIALKAIKLYSDLYVKN